MKRKKIMFVIAHPLKPYTMDSSEHWVHVEGKTIYSDLDAQHPLLINIALKVA